MKKKKVVYVCPVGGIRPENSGEVKKVMMQVDALRKNGLETELQHLRMRSSENSLLNKILKRFLFYKLYSLKDSKSICLACQDAEAVYIRKERIDSVFLQMIKDIREMYPQIKILLEIPTYPYDAEFYRLVDRPLLWKEKFYRRNLNRYVNRAVMIANDKMVFGMQCINIDNGFDTETVKIKKPTDNQKDCIRLLGVAAVSFFHGYDRVIRGLHEYYMTEPDKRVEFHIVGGGTYIKVLKKISADLNVEQYVYFHGWMHGDELDNMFDQCDIGVGCLGVHRKGLIYTNSLKLREYAARGIPFFYGDVDLAMEEHFKEYLMNVPASDDPIVIPDIIQFYGKMKEMGFDRIAVEMHRLAEENLSWTKQMKPVGDYILLDDT